MLTYPVTLTPDDNGTLLVTFPDIPEANSVGKNQQEALSNAKEALAAALEIYREEKRPIPTPSKARKGQPVVMMAMLKPHYKLADLMAEMPTELPMVEGWEE